MCIRDRPMEYTLQELIDKEALQQPCALTLKQCDEQLDDEAFTAFNLTSLCVNPEDEQWKNLGVMRFINGRMLPSIRSIRFDGDHLFVDELGLRLTYFIFGRDVANVKSAVFCLDAMQRSININAVLRFLSLDIAAVLKQLLIHLDEYNELACGSRGGFFSTGHLEDWRKTQACFVPGLISPNLLQWLLFRGEYLKSYVREHLNKIKAQQMPNRQLLDEFLPKIAHFYRYACSDPGLTPVQRFLRLPKNYEETPKTIISQSPQAVTRIEHHSTHTCLLYT